MGNTNIANLKQMLTQHKHVIRIISYETCFDHTVKLLKPKEGLNVCKLKETSW